MRGLSDQFIGDLTTGFLNLLLVRVKREKDLDLEIRNGYLNIYYKGNSLLKLTETKPSCYRVDVHPKFTSGTKFPPITDKSALSYFIEQIPWIKENIIVHGKNSLEIEYEQMIIRANNYEPHNNSEYFIVDRQYAAGQQGRFDMTGFYWPRNSRRRGNEVSVCLFEVKFALNQDIQEVHNQLDRYYLAIQSRAAEIAGEAEHIFRQKLALGLFNQPAVRLEAMQTLSFAREIERFQFVLLLVDYNPYSQLFRADKLMELPFGDQIRIFHGGFAMWGNNLSRVHSLEK